jgi:hypothetical protein
MKMGETQRNGLVIYVHQTRYTTARITFGGGLPRRLALRYAADLLTRRRGKLEVERVKAVGYESTSLALHLQVHAAA